MGTDRVSAVSELGHQAIDEPIVIWQPVSCLHYSANLAMQYRGLQLRIGGLSSSERVSIISTDELLPRPFGVVGFAELAQRAQFVHFGGLHVRIPAPCDLFLQLCVADSHRLSERGRG